jgi:hypothetical protein
VAKEGIDELTVVKLLKQAKGELDDPIRGEPAVARGREVL